MAPPRHADVSSTAHRLLLLLLTTTSIKANKATAAGQAGKMKSSDTYLRGAQWTWPLRHDVTSAVNLAARAAGNFFFSIVVAARAALSSKPAFAASASARCRFVGPASPCVRPSGAVLTSGKREAAHLHELRGGVFLTLCAVIDVESCESRLRAFHYLVKAQLLQRRRTRPGSSASSNTRKKAGRLTAHTGDQLPPTTVARCDSASRWHESALQEARIAARHQ